jgi:hypothetical protein
MINYVDELQAHVFTVDSLPELEILCSMLSDADSMSLDADITEYKKTYRFNWLYLVPNVGYDIYRRTPTVVFNTSDVVNHFQRKRSIKRKIISMEKRSELKSKNNVVKLTNIYQDLKSGIVRLQLMQETYAKYALLFDIKKQQYEKNEISAEVYITEEIKFTEKRKVILSAVDYINSKFTDIELLLSVDLFQYLKYEDYLNVKL